MKQEYKESVSYKFHYVDLKRKMYLKNDISYYRMPVIPNVQQVDRWPDPGTDDHGSALPISLTT
jgi:hypothetical protein